MKFQFSFSIQVFQSPGIDQDAVLWAFAAEATPTLLSELTNPPEELPAGALV